MKGQNAYTLAKAIHEKMYTTPSMLQPDEQKVLYFEYFKLIRKAAYQGHIEGMFDMGQQYEDISYLGLPNPIYNPERSVYWYAKACQKGHAEACNNLSNLHALGEGCQQDFSKALDLLKRSAELGSLLGKKNYKMKLRDLAKTGYYLRGAKINVPNKDKD
jgi:TPR repeat protein